MPSKYIKKADRPKVTDPVKSAVSVTTENPDPAPEVAIDGARPFPTRDTTPSGQDRVTFKVVDNKIDTEGMQARTAEKIREVLKASMGDPAFLQWAGISAGTVPGLEGTVVTPEDAKYILELEASLMTAGLGLRYKLPMADVREIMAWKEAEHEVLDARLARLMTKYLPENAKQNLDWITFGGTFLSMSTIKIALVARLASERKDGAKTSPRVVMNPTKSDPVIMRPAPPSEDAMPADPIPPPIDNSVPSELRL